MTNDEIERIKRQIQENQDIQDVLKNDSLVLKVELKRAELAHVISQYMVIEEEENTWEYV